MTYAGVLTTSLTVLAFVLTLSSVGHAQSETVHEAIARGATGRVSTAPSGHPPTVTDLLRETDIVVRGIIGQPRAYLSGDKRDVYTDYALKNPAILYAKQVLSSAVPGASADVTVTQLGGTIEVNGVKFTQQENGLLPLEPGVEGLFLLKRVDNRYQIAGTYFGAFRIAAGRVTPFTMRQSFAPEYRDASTEHAVAEIMRQLRTLR